MWINDREQREAILDGCKYLTRTISIHAEAEILYVRKASKNVALLQDRLIDAYTAILKFAGSLETSLKDGLPSQFYLEIDVRD